MMEKRQQAITPANEYEKKVAVIDLKRLIDQKLNERLEKMKVVNMLEFKANQTLTETIDTENRNQRQSLEFVNGLSDIEVQRMLEIKKLEMMKIDNDLANLTAQLMKLEGK